MRLFLIISLAIVTNLCVAQEMVGIKNVVKTTPLNYLVGEYNLAIERQLGQLSSVELYGGLKVNSFFNHNRSSGSYLPFPSKGYEIKVGYRKYIDGTSLIGAYFSPQFSFRNLERVDIYSSYDNRQERQLITASWLIGYQGKFLKHFTFNPFFGLGVQRVFNKSIPGPENPDPEITRTNYYQHFIAANISLGFAF